MRTRVGCIALFLLGCISIQAQQIDIETLMKTSKVKVYGGINANGMYNNAGTGNQDPFTYTLSGNLGASYKMFSMPISYTITNLGDQFGYQMPYDFNRFSLAPKYKWIQAYLGDASMSFSNYTLNGHPFRGIGAELTPKGPVKVSFMGGRLLKPTEADSLGYQVATYKRIGVGGKIDFEQDQYKLEYISFYAKDKENSIVNSGGAIAKENSVNSFKVHTTVIPNVELEVEYALSILYDLIPQQIEDNTSTLKTRSTHKAVKTSANYNLSKYRIGLVYENVDPEYQTLGAMYFNNDLENVGVTFSGPFVKDRLMISTQLGYQRDNLDKKKAQDSKRLVGTLNASFIVNEQLNISGSYSNFSTHTNRRLDQFDYINDPNLNPADTLNYKQLSQNANANINYILGKEKQHNINFNYSIAGQANKQGGVIRKGQSSTVQNFNLVHTLTMKSIAAGLSTSLNYTDNKISAMNSNSYGAGVNFMKKFLDNKLNATLGGLYNQMQTKTGNNSVYGVKFNASYVFLEQHNFSLNGVQMFRQLYTGMNTNDLTLTFNYSYSF
ncbi:hypothetical protein [Myroides sp. WP-1]|uniref:hypothetical protein n=1 Tax=Myroides sp. WP-1 TaxID=2759944 RepID=UPI0015F7D2BE|nr:hypothetical protein [Myroides sp. WP-1]MBB1140655.1 hypothetical protein [Myroides sp. WP-1]